MNSKPMNAFDDAADILGVGIDALFADNGNQYALIDLDQIELKPQIREVLEDEENTLHELAASIKAQGILQTVLLRPNGAGYELVAGERRYRAARMAGMTQIPAVIREMTDEEAEDAQFAENVHRKNLTQIEEAKKIQRDLDRLGSVEAVLQKHHKSKAWLSKMLSLLSLPEQAGRLVRENISADVEVINSVKFIEARDPKAAKELVHELKKTRGRESARKKVEAVKTKVKSKPNKDSDVSFAHAKQPNHVSKVAPPKQAAAVDACGLLERAYRNILEVGATAQSVLKSMSDAEKESLEAWLRAFYDAGTADKDVARTVMLGFRQGTFGTTGAGAFALSSFLYGINGGAKFNLLNILGSVRS